MGRKHANAQPRGHLRDDRRFIPELGAAHSIVYSEAYEDFLDSIKAGLSIALPDIVTHDDFGRETNSRKAFRIYDDPNRANIRVLERRLSAAHARRHRVTWTKQDVGRIKGLINDRIHEYDLGNIHELPARFSSVMRLGDADEAAGGGRVLGLVLEQGTSVAQFLADEHEIVVNGIATSLARFRYPYSTYVPTFPWRESGEKFRRKGSIGLLVLYKLNYR